MTKMRYQFVPHNIRLETMGSQLKEAVTTSSHEDGDSWKVEFYTDFAGFDTAVIEPGSANEEVIRYNGVNIDTDELAGVIRDDPQNHAAGVFVQAGAEPTTERIGDLLIDGIDLAPGIALDSSIAGFWPLGPYDPETSETGWLETDDDDEAHVVSAPIGGAPVFGDDLISLPAVGGGDGSTTDPNTGKPPPGMGFEDGNVPEGSVTPLIIGSGLNTIFVRFTTIANTSIVNYEIHCSISTGFTPDATSLVGEVDAAGTPDTERVFVFDDFPSLHDLDGAVGFDPPDPDVTYFFKIVPRDASGPAAGPYPEASGSPFQIEGIHIAANTITADNIAAGTITAAELDVDELSAISANLGTVTAGDITGVTITGGLFRTATSGSRIEIAEGLPDRIQFLGEFGASGISQQTDGLILEASDKLILSSLDQVLVIDAPLVIGVAANEEGNALLLRNVTAGGDIPTPPAGYVAIYFRSDVGEVHAKNSAGLARKLNENPF